MNTVDSSAGANNMQKWGIPEKEMVSAEITLLERLVWVPYKDHWWPALLYNNYTELQAHLYEELDMVLKAQFAVAIMRQMNETKNIKVARLLGREILEVVEVDDNQYAEFYWQLPRVLPMACKKSRYGNDTKLYLDFHRALDQVEEIIRDISENSFNLMATAEKKTWLQRAEDVLKNGEPTVSSPNNNKSSKQSKQRSTLSPEERRQLLEEKAMMKAAMDQEDSNFLFNAIDGMMERINSTYECVSGDVTTKTAEDGDTTRNIVFNPCSTNTPTNSQTKSQMDAHSEALLKQKEYRKALREVISQQRELRGASPTDVDVRNPSFDEHGGRVRQNISEEAVYNKDIGGMKQQESYGTSKDDSERPLPSKSAEEDAASFQNRSFSKANREQISSVPELRVVQNKVTSKSGNHGDERPPQKTEIMMETREENPEDDREAIKAAARAAAAIELDATFWDTLTCHTIDS